MSEQTKRRSIFGGLARSKSTGNAKGQSPPDELDGVSKTDRYVNPPDPLIEPVSPGNSTPTKKSWERHYRSFLTRKSFGGASTPDSAPSLSHADLKDAASPATRRSLFTGRLMRSSSRGGGSSNSSKDPLDAGVAAAAAAAGGMPQIPILTTTQPATPAAAASTAATPAAASTSAVARVGQDEELAIRGGNFFQTVFGREKSDRVVMIDTRSAPHRRIKSNDTLDSTMRRGRDKSFSPAIRQKKTVQEGDAVHGGVSQTRSRPLGSLPRALSSSGHQTKEMKKAFTAFHNSSKFAQDSTSAYLGDDPSVQRNAYFAQQNQQFLGPPGSFSLSERQRPSWSATSLQTLDTVDEHMQVHRSMRMLRKVHGPEAWEPGRRYLIAPAALSTSPLKVLSILSGSNRTLPDYTGSPFGMVKLGRATVTYEGMHKRNSIGWSTCDFVLRQNYLMEYDTQANMSGKPRGFAHLQYARCYEHADFPDALELEFYMSPCSKSERRTLFLRVQSREERDRWVMCLNDAAKLSIDDFYDFDMGEPIGSGRYAAVYPARRKTAEATNDGEKYNCAIKVIDKNEFWKRVIKGIERADTVVREVSVQGTLTVQCCHLPSFLQIRSFFETADHIVMELELLGGKDLFRYVASKGTLDEPEAAEIMHDLLTGLDVMQRIGVAHRDVKPANILMCDKEKHGVCVKLCDFGMSAFVGVDGLVRGRCGTPGYVAPEIFAAGLNAGYGNKVDIFSAGVTLYIMLCGYEPFYGESDAELVSANKDATVEFEDDWQKISEEARDLVKKMMEKDPEKRIQANEALHHPWITKNAPKRAWELDSSLERMALSSADIPDGTACTIS